MSCTCACTCRSARTGTAPLPPSIRDAGPSDDIAKQIRKLEKKIRETRLLQQQQALGRALTAEELVKVGSLTALEAQVAPLRIRNDVWASASASAAGSSENNQMSDARSMPFAECEGTAVLL